MNDNSLNKSDAKNFNNPEISVVCPLFNEVGNVKKLHKKILKSLRSLDKSFEIIFVNDGSFDGTKEVCEKLRPLKLINFRKNFGQTAAIDCGFKEAKGEIIITLDGDLQNDPSDFSKLLEKIYQGYDVVSGWRKNRKDKFSKKFISKGAEILRKFFINDQIHDSGCTLKAYKKECFYDLDLYGEMHRFIPAILKIHGFTVTEVKVRHQPRKSGKTKYGWKRTIKGFLDLVSVWFWKKYSNRPLHLFGGLGSLLTMVGFGILIFLAVLRIFYHIPLSDKIWPLISIFLILAGLQLFISGLLADIAVKSYYKNNKKHYSIKHIQINS
ncbi:MAG: glycosyltransferase [Candidatus Moranbacteria bacterium]|nr:glycosyltransferase [Candidatus Moranbacteria bacterium]